MTAFEIILQHFLRGFIACATLVTLFVIVCAVSYSSDYSLTP